MPRDSDQYDVFVSYAREDNSSGWIEAFMEALLAEHRVLTGGRELACFFDRSEIRSGEDWRHRIHDGLARSRVLLTFISPHYFASEWCRREWHSWIEIEISKHILSDGILAVYIVEVPELDTEQTPSAKVSEKIALLCGMAGQSEDFLGNATQVVHQLRRRHLLPIFPFFREGLKGLRRHEIREVLAGLANDLETRAVRIRRASASANTVPPYNRNFTGRLDELLKLRERLTNVQTGVVCGVNGLGGIGKTELAFTYAHAFASVYPGGRFLISCEGKSSIREAAVVLGESVDFRPEISDEDRKTPDRHFAAIVACLGRRLEKLGSVLLVLDNVTDPASIIPEETDALTRLGPNIHLLVTTRLEGPDDGSWLTLGELPADDALVLLEKHRPFGSLAERKSAEIIVRRLGGLALAVELVAAFLAAHPGASYENTAAVLGLEQLESMATDTSAQLRRHNHERRLTAVLVPSIEGLKPAERLVLEMAAFLPADVVALPWLKELLAAELPEALTPTGPIGDMWTEILGRLTRLALFGPAGPRDQWSVRVHRLVQEVVRMRMPDERVATCMRAVAALAWRREAALDKVKKWEEASWEIESLQALAERWAEECHPLASKLLDLVGRRWYRLASWSRAELLIRRALAIAEASKGKDDLDVGGHLNSLGLLLSETNRHAEAEQTIRRALAIAELTFGRDDIRVATALNNLALLLMHTNREEEAEPLQRRALAINEAHYGKDDPRLATELNNLSRLLTQLNRAAEAEPLQRRALALDEALLGENHPDLASDLCNLAQLLPLPDQAEEAETLIRRALAITEMNFGSDHPDVAACLNTLAWVLHSRNRIAQAEALARRALAIHEASFGSKHPKFAISLNNLAQIIRETNRLTEAESLIRRALAIDEASYSANHPSIAIDLLNLGTLLLEMKRIDQAEPVMRRSLEILLVFTRRTQYEHPALRETLRAYVMLLERKLNSPSRIRKELVLIDPELPTLLDKAALEPKHGFSPIPYRIRIGVTSESNGPNESRIEDNVRHAIDTLIPQMFTRQVRESLDRMQLWSTRVSYTVFSRLAQSADRRAVRTILQYPSARLEAVVRAPHDYHGNDSETDNSHAEVEDLLGQCRHPLLMCTQISTEEQLGAVDRTPGRLLVDHCDVLMAVWNGKGSREFGSTAELVEYALSEDVPVLRMWDENVLLPKHRQLSGRGLWGVEYFNQELVSETDSAARRREIERCCFDELPGHIRDTAAFHNAKEIVERHLVPYYVRSSLLGEKAWSRYSAAMYSVLKLGLLILSALVIAVRFSNHTLAAYVLGALMLGWTGYRVSAQGRAQFYRQWLESLFLNDRLRSAIALVLSGLEPSRTVSSANGSYAPADDDWSVRVWDEVWNRLPAFNPKTQAEFAGATQATAESWIADRLTRRAPDLKKKRKRELLEMIGVVAAGASVLVAAVHLSSGALRPGWPRALCSALTLYLIVVPAALSIRSGLRVIRQRLRIDKSRARGMQKLEKLQTQFGAPAARDELPELLRQAEGVAIEEMADLLRAAELYPDLTG